MATKTIINCMDQQQQPTSSTSASTPHQGISIKIDQSGCGGSGSTTGILNIPTNYLGPSSAALVSNVIKIQHSCQTASSSTTPGSSASTSLTTLNGTDLYNNNTKNSNNKLLIDINRKQTTINDSSYGNGDCESSQLVAPAVVQVKCLTSREMLLQEKPLEAPIMVNGIGNFREKSIGSNDHNHEDDNHEEGDHDLRESTQEKPPNQQSNNFNESNQTSITATSTTTTTTETSTTTIQQQQTSQQVNGNKENNNGHHGLNQTIYYHSHSTTSNGQEKQGNDDETNFKHDNEADLHHNDDHKENNNGDNDDDDCGLKLGKRDSCLDIVSHDGKRWPAKENSNSLLTKADTATTPQLSKKTTSVIIGENLYWKKVQEEEDNSQDFSEYTNKNSTKSSTPTTTTSSAHVVKIQINPQNTTPNPPNLSTEKKISIVKIENEENFENNNKKENIKESEVNSSEILLKKPEEEKEDQEKSKEKELENQRNGKSLKSELHLNLEKMVQKSQNNNSVTVSSGGSSSSNNITTTSSMATSAPAQNSVNELNVTNPSYLYYSTMSSGQFSPCDTLDSGTGSDLESQNHTPHTPTAHLLLPNKKSSTNGLEMHLKTTKVRVSQHANGNSKDKHNCNSSSYTDSEESEASSLSCDSLHSNEFMRQSSQSPTIQNKLSSPSRKVLGSFLPDSLLRDIKNLKLNNTEYEAENENEEDEDHIEQRVKAHKQRSESTYEPISSQDYMMAQNDYVQTRNTVNQENASTNSAKRASMPSKTFVLNQEDGTFIDMKMNSMPRKYEADKYYNFHVNEHENFRSFGNNNNSGFPESGSESLSEYESRSSLHDDVFAGYKDLRCGSATSTIRSNKGTVRGVKNRVRNGIATFLQLQQPNMKNFKEKDSGKVVLYTTSMGIIRDTYAKCSNVKKILRTLLIKFEERDVFMSVEYQQEIKERMHSEIIKVPQLFVEGQHIGDAETVERLNESGELRQLLKPYKSIATTYTCQTCGGYRLLPCPSCKGSKKSVHRNHFTAEFVALKCMNCDEVGLVKCHNC
ncbi:uncharacterized protein [Musca autumnalis]|uniref:uncharacterized protein n=1 Tax=Musca autumnalis TaxID=221902 RepID=UPI003CF3F99C